MIYLDDETLNWANKGLEEFNTSVVQKDCNGVVLKCWRYSYYNQRPCIKRCWIYCKKRELL